VSLRCFGDNDIGYRIKMESIVSNTTWNLRTSWNRFLI
jgi:hypothetical protein